MQRFSITFLVATVAFFASVAQSLDSFRPNPYKPSLPELMIQRLTNVEGVALNPEDIPAFPNMLKHRSLIEKPDTLYRYDVAYLIEKITPDYLSMLSTEFDKNSLPPGFDEDDSVLLTQLGVLSGKGNKTKCVLVNTVSPDGLKMSEVRFFEFPSYEKMLQEYEKEIKGESDFSDYLSYIMATDSVVSELYGKAVDLGILTPLPSPDDETEDDNIGNSEAKEIPSKKFIKEPNLTDFFNIPGGTEGKEVKEAIAEIPFALISYSLSPEDLSLTATLNFTSLVSYETGRKLETYLRAPLKFIWDGKQYKLLK